MEGRQELKEERLSPAFLSIPRQTISQGMTGLKPGHYTPCPLTLLSLVRVTGGTSKNIKKLISFSYQLAKVFRTLQSSVTLICHPLHWASEVNP